MTSVKLAIEISEKKRIEFIAKIKEFLHENYETEMTSASMENKALDVDYSTLHKYNSEIADLLLIEPDNVFEIINEAVKDIDLPNPFNVRFYNLPELTSIRNLRSRHLSKLISVEGTVRRASEIRPEITESFWECSECGEEIIQPIRASIIMRPFQCTNDTCRSRKAFKQTGKKMVDTRWITIEEPFELTEGDRPSQVTIVLIDDLVSPEMRRITDPGNRLKISGILRETPKGKSYSTKLEFFIDGNHVEPLEIGWHHIDISESDKERIKEMAKDPGIYETLVDSLAPSLYGMREIKESIILQLFGGVPQHLKDGTHIRGDIHILLIGDPASGKCVTGDTKVVLKNGELRPIKNIVENKLKDNIKAIDDGFYANGNDDLISMSLDGKAQETKANIFWKRKSPKYLYSVETFSGKKITVTPTHPFFTCSDGYIMSKKASELNKNDFIASPSKIPTKGKTQEINVEIEKSKANNAKHMKIPEKTSKELCKFLAYLIAEGCVQRSDSTCLIWFTNNDPLSLREYEDCARIFNLPVHKRKPHKGKRAFDYYISSIELGRFLKQLEPALLKKSRYKKIPDIIMRTSDDEIKSFLRVYFDCEANVEDRGIELASASRELLDQIQVLLLRFGINSQIHSMLKKATNSPKPKLREYHRLAISGSDVKLFKEKINFSMSRKKEKLDKLTDKNSITDVVPNLSKALFGIRKGLRLTQFGMGVPRSTYQHFERGDRNPTRKPMKLILDIFKKRLEYLDNLEKRVQNASIAELKNIRNELGISQDSLSKKAGFSQTLLSQYESGRCGKSRIKPKRKSVENTTKRIKHALTDTCSSVRKDNELKTKIESLHKLSNSDIFWDRIKRIKKIQSKEKWVYDLQVPFVHNFIANQIFVHNSQLLKLVPEIVPRARYVSGKGVTGAGLCMSYDTLIPLAHGEIKYIGDIVESVLKKNKEKTKEGWVSSNCDLEINMLDFKDLKIKKRKVSKVFKLKSKDKLIKIKTRTGKEIKLTKENPVLVIRNGELTWVKANAMKTGDYIATAKKIPINHEPTFMDNKTSRLMGMVAGDGDVGQREIRFHNTNEYYLNEFSNLSYKLGFNPRKYYQKNRIPCVRVASKSLCDKLDSVGIPRGIKCDKIRIPEEILKSNKLLSEFISGIFNCDGGVVLKGNGSYIEFTTTSKRMAIELQTALLRFSVLSKIREREPSKKGFGGKKKKYCILIRGADNLEKFREHINFTGSKKEKLDKILSKNLKPNTNIDVIPGVGERLNEVRKSLKIGIKNNEDLYYLRQYEYGNRNFSPESLLRFVSLLKKEKKHEYFDFLGKLAASDIFWDKIVSTDTIKEEWVYDLTVEGEHNFIANNFIVHNTATVTKDEQFMGGWVLEAGALVLANKGVLSIDEFEKMSPDDMIAMHEALEQGTISIAKASIVATLPAKTSVLAGGNPKFSRFDPYMAISKQITLPDSLLSRFDLKFALRDLPDTTTDKLIVDHILNAREADYTKSLPKIEQALVRKYIAYARGNCSPVLTKEAGKILKTFYLKTRKKAEGGSAPIPITLRQFEALVRLSEASAKIQLSETVRKSDAERAIKLVKFSLRQLGFDPETGMIDIDRAEGASTSSSERGKIKIVMDIINEMSEKKKEISLSDLTSRARSQEVEGVEEIIEKLKREGMLFEPNPGFVQKV
ncbi:MAG: LAGLIDADG family homing endonuclease [Nanoarchaeota archaeon]